MLTHAGGSRSLRTFHEGVAKELVGYGTDGGKDNCLASPLFCVWGTIYALHTSLFNMSSTKCLST